MAEIPPHFGERGDRRCEGRLKLANSEEVVGWWFRSVLVSGLPRAPLAAAPTTSIASTDYSPLASLASRALSRRIHVG